MRTVVGVTLLLYVLCVSVHTEPLSYSGYQVLDIFPVNEEQNKKLLELEVYHELDFWSEPGSKGRPVTVKIPPSWTIRLPDLLEDLGINYKVAVEDVGVNVKREQDRLQTRAVESMAYNQSDYNNLTEIEAQLQVYVNDCPVGFTCEVVDIGQTFENRRIKRFSISQGTGRRAYWVDSNIHAREWLSSATNLRFIDNFVYNYNKNANVTALLDKYDWHFVPIMNPDGYEYTWTNDRYWRKSRTDIPTSNCTGVDLNRNYDVRWGESGTSNLSCSNTYGGDGAASCIETKAHQAEIDRLTPTLDALVSMHTYSYYLLHPYGHEWPNRTCASAPDHDNLYGAAQDMATAIWRESGRLWDYGIWCTVLYPSSGTTMDYAYNEGTGIKYSYTPELRGTDFVIDPVNIQPSFEEMWAALVALENYVSTH